MRVLVDILHPAHVHFFRNFVREMEGRGHAVRITARAKDRSTELLDRFALPYVHLSTAGSRPTPVDLVKHTRGVRHEVREFRPDVLTGIMGPAIALAGKLTRTPSVVFYDTEFAVQTNRFVYPLAHSVCTPDCYQGRVRGRHVTYAGYHELAYLHPDRFRPDPSKLASFGLLPGEPFSIVRFVSWQAIHDKGERALSAERKRELVGVLEGYGRVLVSSEAPLPPELARYAITGPVEDIHHLLAHAQLIVGESATMSSEAAVLGVPAVFIAKTGRGYTDDQERRYGLVRHVPDTQVSRAIEAIGDFMRAGPREFGLKARARLLEEKIDVTAWMVDYFESNF
jgi:uncharacterized protein